MLPAELVRLLVQRDGGELPVARRMGSKNFQPTLWRFANGMTSELKRPSAEKIAKHFGISVDALFSESAATAEAQRLGLLPTASRTLQLALVLREPAPPPLNFADRQELDAGEWATWEAVNLVLSPEELQSIRKRADAMMERARREMAQKAEKCRRSPE
jgi:hypothetical protein